MAGLRPDRRLAAILAADVVGYCRLIERDETGTLDRLRAQRRDVIEPVLADHGGRIVKLMGDGVLVELASASAAVQAAVDIQRALAAQEPDTGLRLRIGVSLGDVVHEDGDIFGEGVNLAARLQELAGPGGICVSRAVHEQTRHRLDVTFAPMGRQRIRGLVEPVEVWRALPEGAVPAPPRLGLATALAVAALLLAIAGLGWWM
jgi:class 3 adenylate cyclase